MFISSLWFIIALHIQSIQMLNIHTSISLHKYTYIESHDWFRYKIYEEYLSSLFYWISISLMISVNILAGRRVAREADISNWGEGEDAYVRLVLSMAVLRHRRAASAHLAGGQRLRSWRRYPQLRPIHALHSEADVRMRLARRVRTRARGAREA